MCGRFALFCSKEALQLHYHLNASLKMVSRYNIAPTQVAPLIHTDGLTFARWGLVPHWNTPLATIPAGYINARLENIASKPSFRDAFKHSRCLIPASGYYEWKEIKGVKQPYFVCLKNQEIFSFAGVMSTWRDELNYEHKTFTIVTKEVSHHLKEIHPRMPFVISPEYYQAWLSANVKTLNEKVLQSFESTQSLQFYPVSRKVNNPLNDDCSCILHL